MRYWIFINVILPQKEAFYQNKHHKRVLATLSHKRSAPAAAPART
jgi:hypothetical protein